MKPVQLYPEVEKFLGESPLRPFIGGKYVAPHRKQTFRTIDPGSGTVLAEVAACGAEDIEHAVQAAEKAFRQSEWSRLPANERAVYLHRLADLVEKRKDILAQIEALDCGKIFAQALGDVANFCQTMRYYADLSVHVQLRSPIAIAGHEAWTVRHPHGVCAFIFPWNFPILLLGWGLSAALAAGNTVVVKPAEDTPLSSLFFGRLAREAGIPDGVINILPGLGEEAGAALARHPRIKRMSFTGSPEVGKKVAEVCGANLVPVKLELGGKGGAIVFEDVDPEQTAAKLVGAITFHSGQVCCTASRWIVHKNIYDRFIESSREKMQSLRIGHQYDAQTTMGPVVSPKQRQRVLTYIKRGQQEGAKALLPGGRKRVAGYEDGCYVEPALLAGDINNIAAQQEIFGPVAYVVPFRSEEEAIRLVNSTNYGLANSVWTNDLKRAASVAEQNACGQFLDQRS